MRAIDTETLWRTVKKFWKWIKSHLWIRRAHKRVPYVPQHDVIVVVAGNYRQFVQWCFKNGLHPSSHQLLYIPINGGYKLHGRAGGIKEVIYTGTWRTRPDLRELQENLDYVVNTNRAIYCYEITSREDPY